MKSEDLFISAITKVNVSNLPVHFLLCLCIVVAPLKRKGFWRSIYSGDLNSLALRHFRIGKGCGALRKIKMNLSEKFEIVESTLKQLNVADLLVVAHGMDIVDEET